MLLRPVSSIVVRQKQGESDRKETLRHPGLDRNGRYYRATQDDGAPIINVPAQMPPIVIVSIGLTSLNDDRVIALQLRCEISIPPEFWAPAVSVMIHRMTRSARHDRYRRQNTNGK